MTAPVRAALYLLSIPDQRRQAEGHASHAAVRSSRTMSSQAVSAGSRTIQSEDTDDDGTGTLEMGNDHGHGHQ
jgi:hypothetical protein